MYLSILSILHKIIYYLVEITTNENGKNSVKDAKITIFSILNQIYFS